MSVTYPLRLFFDCSTAHLSPASGAYLELRSRCPELIASTPYGWFLWAGDDRDDDVPANLVAIMEHARALDADYILFDRDAPVNDVLPTFDWSS